MLKHIPNLLTIIRFLLIPIIVLAILQQNYVLAFIILTLSGITDILDGMIARKFNLITNLGKLLDPLADKATQITVLATLSFNGIIPFWIIAIVFVKEAIMIAGASFLYGKELVVSSKWWGKLATVLFYIAIVISLIQQQFAEILSQTAAQGNIFAELFLVADTPFYAFAILTTIFSLFMYFNAFYRHGYLKVNNENTKEADLNIRTKKKQGPKTKKKENQKDNQPEE